MTFPGRVYKCRCGKCGCETRYYGTPAEAIEAWNERAPDPRLQEAVNKIVVARLTLLDNDTTPLNEFNAGEFQGLKESLEILRKHIPELKEKQDGKSLDKKGAVK